MADEKNVPSGFMLAYLKAVKARVNGDKKHGWGVDDSEAVILALISEDSGASVDDIRKASPDMVRYIRAVINPSAHRQILEEKGILEKTEGRKKAKENAFADYENV